MRISIDRLSLSNNVRLGADWPHVCLFQIFNTRKMASGASLGFQSMLRRVQCLGHFTIDMLCVILEWMQAFGLECGAKQIEP